MYPHNMYKPYPYHPPSDNKKPPSDHGGVKGAREHWGQKRTKCGHNLEPEGEEVEF